MIKLTQAEILLIEKLGHKIYTVNYLNWILNDDRLPGSDKPYWHAKGFYDAIQGMAIREAERLTAERDAAVRGYTTTITRDICYDHGEMTSYGAESCDKCGTKQPDRYPHCPGCGRRIKR